MIRITLHVEPETEPVRGNALVSGDDALDRACEDELLARLERGDEWAWCQVGVTVAVGDLSATQWLGGCSYEGEADFRAGGYYDDKECKDALVRDARAILAALATDD
jgi:hypothetical protein